MNERIRELRKKLGKTQEEFSQNLGLSRNFIAQVESGSKNPSDRTINDICREFNVNEKWLLTGEGEMFAAQTKNQEIAKFLEDVAMKDDDDFIKRFALSLSRMSPEGWDAIEKFVDSLNNK